LVDGGGVIALLAPSHATLLNDDKFDIMK